MKTGQDIKKLGKKVKREKETPEKLEIKSKINEMLKIGEKRFKFQTWHLIEKPPLGFMII